MLKGESNALIYIALASALILLSWGVFNYFKTSEFSGNYKKALDAENPIDICATPSGYTDEQWRTHMGHHPDRYKECLQ